MVIFHSYVSLPEGNQPKTSKFWFHQQKRDPIFLVGLNTFFLGDLTNQKKDVTNNTLGLNKKWDLANKQTLRFNE